ncbi:VOC family protein [Streptomyces sp. SM1P]
MTRHGPLNEFCWMDLKTRDPSGTAAFFSAVLGWDFAVDETDWRRAVVFRAGDHRIGGLSDLAQPVYPPGLPAHVAYYLAVDDVDHRTAVAAENGARVLVPPFDAGDQGRIATLIDPVGAAVSLWRPRGSRGGRYRLRTRAGRSLTTWSWSARTPSGPGTSTPGRPAPRSPGPRSWKPPPGPRRTGRCPWPWAIRTVSPPGPASSAASSSPSPQAPHDCRARRG